jgi:hypothetical protein
MAVGKTSTSEVLEFWGIDQCGAAIGNGRAAKPLQAARLFQSKTKDNAQIEFFRLTSLRQIWDHLKTPNPWIGIDSVFGIPSACQAQFGNPREEFRKASQFQWEGRRFGAQVAEAFFKRFEWPRPLPRRLCEVICHSNSVLTNRPAQKNIQTGTFRTWSDLGEIESTAYVLWPFETSDSQSLTKPIVMEVYPTLFWRQVLNLQVRRWSQLRDLLRVFPQIELTQDPQNPDQADAAIVALGLMLMHQKSRRLQVPPRKAPPVEGWIYGA